MKTLILMTIALALSACGMGDAIGGLNTAGSLPAPITVAQKTTLDETAGRLVTVGYTATSKAAALAIRTGLVKDPATIKRIGDLDVRAYALVQAVRQAYLAGNSTSYLAALQEARLGLEQFLSAVKGATP